jgi:hypothetical protein
MKRITFPIVVMLALLLATGVFAGPSRSIGGLGLGNAAAESLIVATDGSAYIIQVAPPTKTLPARLEVVAVRAGAVVWRTDVDSDLEEIVLSGDRLLIVTKPSQFGWRNQGPARGSTLIAISTLTGAELWKLALEGVAKEIEPVAGGAYLTLAMPEDWVPQGPSPGPGGGLGLHAPRALVAVGSNGTILWTVALDQ